MSERRVRAGALAHMFFAGRGCSVGQLIDGTTQTVHSPLCDGLRNVIAHRDAASDAREDRLREALERIREMCTPSWTEFAMNVRDVAASTLAVVPPRSDR